MSAQGQVDLLSHHSVAETADRLTSLLKAAGIKVFICIDQAQEARSVGLEMPETQLLIFGDPKAGTPAMVKSPSLALDLPLKALIWEAADGNVWLSYNSSEYLQQRHNLESAPFKALEPIYEASIA